MGKQDTLSNSLNGNTAAERRKKKKYPDLIEMFLLQAPVLRSTSDACGTTQEAARKRRDRKERPYKSDPFSGTEIIPATNRCALREEKASKCCDIYCLNYSLPQNQ